MPIDWSQVGSGFYKPGPQNHGTKIYMAGKVDETGWRDEITWRHQRETEPNRDEWIRGRFSFWNGSYEYVGPFFSGSRHNRDPAEHGSDVVGSHCGYYGAPHPDIFDCCCRALDDCDIVFVWLDDLTAFGTIWEMGYAAAQKKKVVVGLASYNRVVNSDLWFPLCGAESTIEANSAREAFQKLFGPPPAKSQSESPIEEQMLVALRSVLPPHATVQQQAEFFCGRYRADFTVTTPDCKVVVECDGHDFHEKSKEQAARDKKRDRDMQLEGWAVLRFTGSEIFRDAKKCAREVLQFIGGSIPTKTIPPTRPL